MNRSKLSKTMYTTAPRNVGWRASAASGFTLIELMVAITLGVLLSIGLVTLFGATSKSNRVQDAMAQLQENGRYAMARLNADLRMSAHQTTNASGYVSAAPSAAANPNGVVNATVAANVYVATINLPDYSPAGLSAPVGWPGATAWPLSQRNYFQGYECSGGTCAPALPSGTANDLPATGTNAGNRVATSDVLTLRYINSDGWSAIRNELAPSCASASLNNITVTPYAGNSSLTPPIPPSQALNFQTNDLAMLVTGSGAQIFQVSVAGNVLTPINLVGGNKFCFGTSGSSDTVLYNFSRDFLTVTYYLKLDPDPNNGGRVIPVLVRRQSTIAAPGPGSDQELVQGVEQMDFLFGAEFGDGKVSYLTADNMSRYSTFANCPPEPVQYVQQLPAGTVDADCLWRATKSIEVHILVDSINNMYLTPSDMAYQYTFSYDGTDSGKQAIKLPPAPAAAMPSGLIAGNMMRREFVSLIALRNYNP